MRLQREGKVNLHSTTAQADDQVDTSKSHRLNLRLEQTNEITTNHLFRE